MTDQKDVDEEVNIAAPLEEDTEWWQEDGKTVGDRANGEYEVQHGGGDATYMICGNAVSTVKLARRGGQKRTLQMSEAVKAMVEGR